MSLLLVAIASVFVAAAAWLGMRRRFTGAIIALLLALGPLLLDLTAVKAVFVWLGLIGPIVTVIVMWRGLQRVSD